jgi:4,5-DOPA dioxygenase extradiol
MTAVMPVLFLGHGSPMNALEDNAWTRGWAKAAAAIPRPMAILCISAHWETLGVAVTAEARPKTIHDFGGFPQPLFDLQYPAPGSPALAERVAGLLSPTPVRPASDWGLDHGTWSVLVKMYPPADVPVLIVGSGDIVHNLRAADFRRPEAADWALRFRDTANRLIAAGEHAPLIHYETLGPDALASINSAEHYLPLLYVLGLQEPGEAVEIFNDDVFAALSMTSIKVG